jgi:hypothetical protein
MTGLFTVQATNRAHRQTLERDGIFRQQQAVAFVQAIQAEVESFTDSMGELSRVIPSLDGRTALEGNFTANRCSEVFEASAHLLGAVDDRVLRKAIVRAYAAMRAFVDVIEYNNGLATTYKEAMRKGLATNFEAIATRMILVSYTSGIVRYWQDLVSDLREFWERSNAWLRANNGDESPLPPILAAKQ